MIKHMEQEHIILQMEESIKANGNLIWERDKEDNNFKMVQDLKGITIKIKKMEKENFSGQMEIRIQDSLDIINVKEKE